MAFDMNPRDDEPMDRDAYEAFLKTLYPSATNPACHCECWRCMSGGHCVRCDWNRERGR